MCALSLTSAEESPSVQDRNGVLCASQQLLVQCQDLILGSAFSVAGKKLLKQRFAFRKLLGSAHRVSACREVK